MSSEGAKFVFIGGTGRCGTNLLKDILSRHPDICTLPFEHRILIDPDGIIDFYTSYPQSWSPFLADRRIKRLERFLKSLEQEPPIHRMLGDLLRRLDREGKKLSPRSYHRFGLKHHFPCYRRHVNELIRELTAFSFPAAWVGTESYAFRPVIHHQRPLDKRTLAPTLSKFINSLVEDLLNDRGKKIFGEDNTWNILFAVELLELVPSGKFIHIFRDPRDVVASFCRQRWCPSDPVQAAAWYSSLMARWFQIRPSIPETRLHEICLEELVARPEEVMRGLCLFLQSEFDAKMLESDLSKSNTGRWKKEIPKHRLSEVASILSPWMQALGYS